MTEIKNRDINIDIIKALAIISVILLHSLNGAQLLTIGAPLYIWQAVPIFLILQGHNNSMSYIKRGNKRIGQFLRPTFISKKFKRLLFPFLVFFIIQTIYLYFDTPEYFKSVNHLFRLITGGRGPGSYFVPLTIQAQMIVPIMYLAARKSVKGMLVGSFLVNLILEIVSYTLNINEELYRVLIIRFIFALALGVALSFWEDEKFKDKKFYLLVILSAGYIIGVMYFNLNILMEKYWHSQHLLGFFYPLFLILKLKNIDFNPKNKLVSWLSEIGKASYQIFFVQILYFWKPIRSQSPPLPLLLGIAVDVIVPVVLGVGFYHLEQMMWEKIDNRN